MDADKWHEWIEWWLAVLEETTQYTTWDCITYSAYKGGSFAILHKTGIYPIVLSRISIVWTLLAEHNTFTKWCNEWCISLCLKQRNRLGLLKSEGFWSPESTQIGLTCTNEVLCEVTLLSLPLEVTVHQKSPLCEGERLHHTLTSSYHLSHCNFSSLLLDV